jgi:hypothetical protein
MDRCADRSAVSVVRRRALLLWIWVLLLPILFGTLWGAVLGFAAHWSTRGQRGFSSVQTLVARRYDVYVTAEHADQAARYLQRNKATRRLWPARALRPTSAVRCSVWDVAPECFTGLPLSSTFRRMPGPPRHVYRMPPWVTIRVMASEFGFAARVGSGCGHGCEG